jgi:hypothetical protein
MIIHLHYKFVVCPQLSVRKYHLAAQITIHDAGGEAMDRQNVPEALL